jgi:adenylate kinase
LLVLGRQGSGKGTQCVHLTELLNVPHVSSGEVLRAAVQAGTGLGRSAERFMTAGELVPDQLITSVVAQRLAQPDARDRGFVLDGYPRTVTQARALFEMLAPGQIDAAIDLDVPTHVVLGRLAARRVCGTCGTMAVAPSGVPVVLCVVCGGDAVQRADDTSAAIATRLAVYDAETRPLLDWLAERGLLFTVDGVGSADEVARRVAAAVHMALEGGMAATG